MFSEYHQRKSMFHQWYLHPLVWCVLMSVYAHCRWQICTLFLLSFW